MFGTTKARDGRAPTLKSLGIVEFAAARAHKALVASGWAEVGAGYHGSVHAHPGHPEVVVRLARKVDGFGDYAALLGRGFPGSDGPHAPRILDMRVSRCGALTTVATRLSEPDVDAWWLAFAHAVLADDGGPIAEDVRHRYVVRWPGREPRVDHPSHDGTRERFRAAWPGYETFVSSLRAVAPQGLDPNEGNVLVGPGGHPVVNDPICDDGHGLWLSPTARLARRVSGWAYRTLGGVRAVRHATSPGTAALRGA